MSAHTPGPWAQYEGDPLIIIDSDGASLGEMSAGSPNVSRSEQIANARLIAVAPELLAMVRELDAWLAFRPDLTSREEHAKVKDLIAKATGEQL